MRPPAIDIRVVQLLCSRLCHDLAGPIGAVNNGLELIAELTADGAPDAEALDLVVHSARRAATELEFARLAFGFGGGGSGPYVADAARLCQAMLADDRVELVWRASDDLGDVPKDVAKLLMNSALAAHHALKGRGRLTIAIQRAEGGYRLSAVAEGPGAGLDAPFREALGGLADLTEMTPATAQGYFTFALAQLAGGRLSTDESQRDRFALDAVVAAHA